MGRREELQSKLESILGSRNVYYQPPENVQLEYPAIVYYRANYSVKHADNFPYKIDKAYDITFISKNPDEEAVDELVKLPLCRFNRHYIADNLYHDSFTLFY